jgi:DnaJ-class molecular chaperone
MSKKQNQNHYETLELDDTASADEIKKAFRRLSLKYHPDKNQGKPETVEQFQKINEAYGVLGDPAKKHEYDMQSKNPFFNEDAMHMNMNMNNVDELFANIFFGGQQGHPLAGMFGRPGGGSIFQMGGSQMHGGGPNIRIFHNGIPVNPMGGPMGGPMGFMEKPPPINKTVVINMSHVLNGAKIPVEIERWSMENGIKVSEVVTLYVDIFKGIDQNEIIVIKDEGNIVSEQCKGDVKIIVKIENNSSFVRNGLDLFIEHTISLKEALCGFTYELKHLNERVYTINNKTGNIITPEFKKVIPGMGLTRGEHVGNLVLHFHVDFPKTLTEEQTSQLAQIL